MKAAFGVDIGGTAIKIGLVDVDGNLHHKWEFPTRIDEEGRHILHDVAASIRDVMKNLGVSPCEIAGIGLAVPGPVMLDGVVNHCLNLGWGRVNAQVELQNLTGWPVLTGNDGSMAALGEMWRGNARDCNSFVMITLGTGIGGGIVVNRQALIGKDGSAGEIGHILINPDEQLVCVCGNRGCMEQYASARALASRTQEYLLANPGCPTSLLPEGLTGKKVMEAAQKNDNIALMMVDRLAEALGKGTAIIASILNPEKFVIGGGLSHAGETLLERIRTSFHHHSFHAATETPFMLSALGNNAAIFGCAMAVLQPSAHEK